MSGLYIQLIIYSITFVFVVTTLLISFFVITKLCDCSQEGGFMRLPCWKQGTAIIVFAGVAIVLVLTVRWMYAFGRGEKRKFHYNPYTGEYTRYGLSIGPKRPITDKDLLIAASKGDIARLKIFIEGGMNVNAKSGEGQTALMAAAGSGHKDAVKLLLKAGADVNAEKPKSGFTALMWAACGGHKDVVKLLLEAGADVNARTKTGSMVTLSENVSLLHKSRTLMYVSALLMATANGQKDVVKLLLEAGADVNAKSYNLRQDSYTPLSIAKDRCSAVKSDKDIQNYEGIIELLEKSGAED